MIEQHYVVSQNIIMSEGYSEYVDFFSGDLNYSTPLLQINGPNGESFPLNASYSSGFSWSRLLPCWAWAGVYPLVKSAGK